MINKGKMRNTIHDILFMLLFMVSLQLFNFEKFPQNVYILFIWLESHYIFKNFFLVFHFLYHWIKIICQEIIQFNKFGGATTH